MRCGAGNRGKAVFAPSVRSRGRLRSTTDLIRNAPARGWLRYTSRARIEMSQARAPAVHKFCFYPAAAGFCIFGVATLCRFSQPWVTLGDLGSTWVYIEGRGTPSTEKTEELERVEEVLLFSLVARLFPDFGDGKDV